MTLRWKGARGAMEKGDILPGEILVPYSLTLISYILRAIPNIVFTRLLFRKVQKKAKAKPKKLESRVFYTAKVTKI